MNVRIETLEKKKQFLEWLKQTPQASIADCKKNNFYNILKSFYKGQINNAKKEAGLSEDTFNKRKVFISNDLRHEIIQWYKNKISAPSIAVKMQLPINTVYKILKTEGVKTGQKGRYQPMDYNIFEKIVRFLLENFQEKIFKDGKIVSIELKYFSAEDIAKHVNEPFIEIEDVLERRKSLFPQKDKKYTINVSRWPTMSNLLKKKKYEELELYIKAYFYLEEKEYPSRQLLNEIEKTFLEVWNKKIERMSKSQKIFSRASGVKYGVEGAISLAFKRLGILKRPDNKRIGYRGAYWRVITALDGNDAKPKNMMEYVSYVCSKFNIEKEQVESIIRKTINDTRFTGKAPRIIMSGIIYYISKKEKLGITQHTISNILETEEVKVREACNIIEDNFKVI